MVPSRGLNWYDTVQQLPNKWKTTIWDGEDWKYLHQYRCEYLQIVDIKISLTLYHAFATFNNPEEEDYWKLCVVTSIFSLFLECFFPNGRWNHKFSNICHLKGFEFGPVQKIVVWIIINLHVLPLYCLCQTNLIFSSTGQRPTSYCHGIVSLLAMRPPVRPSLNSSFKKLLLRNY